MTGIILKLTSAIALDGKLCRAGSLVEVTESEAKNLLQRGKAAIATEADGVRIESADALPPVDEDGLRTDGPTLDEYVAAGYLAENYPPNGYAAKTAEAAAEAPPAAPAKAQRKR